MNLTSTLDDLKFLVNINSFTKNADGVTLVQKFLETKLVSLGFQVELKKISADRGPLLVARKKGRSEKKIVFIGHADTALELEEQSRFTFDETKGSVHGNGIADNKAGILLAINALTDYLKQCPDHTHELVFVSSPNEEEGSLGCHEEFSKLKMNSVAVLGLEPALTNGNIIASRNGNRWYNIKIQGIQSHSGRFDAPALNPLHDTLEIGQKIVAMNDHPNKVKLTFTSITEPLLKPNVVPPYCELKIDFRFATFEDRDQVHQKIKAILANKDYQCPQTHKTFERSFSISDDCPPMPFKAVSAELCGLYITELKKSHSEHITFDHSGGAADINYFTTQTNATIDGLGPRCFKMHSALEYTLVEDLEHRCKAMVNLLASFNF